ncbi:DUF6401 family natural product biosynthesis protein [Kibdelosporangium philippinense]|uniref:DUF6401 family natural product biosynthesis protein n=1 Tax=Kibdelosporangium philippinense TaxID=211113 RepID=A0ABS8ZXE4_9PSEU|nr:DUF6401 family natural product biosynthesis protein [Kibdelosporangium philippinense]MCE7011381.1 DUF6401 family natural product biosynthesis protein [Kibdelosporangium philippinense]
MSIWDRAARWSARRWLRRLDDRLQHGHTAADHDPVIAAALDNHVHVVLTQLDRDAAIRKDLVQAPPLVLLAIYAEEIHQEAVKAGWEPPLVWTSLDGLSLRLLACCVVARNRPTARALR